MEKKKLTACTCKGAAKKSQYGNRFSKKKNIYTKMSCGIFIYYSLFYF